jgi:hypothetical protein
MNKILKLLGVILVIMFLSVYFSRYNNNYYANQNVLTEEAIVKFEQDIKEGKDITVSSYLKEEKNYDNKLSKIGLKISNGIEIGFKKGLKFLFKSMEGLVE